MLSRFPGWISALALMVSAGCAVSPPPAPPPDGTATTVILLPDADGKVGSVTVRSMGGQSSTIDKAFHAVSTTRQGGTLTEIEPVDAAMVNAVYARLLLAEPTPPRRFLLYFGVGVELQGASLATFPVIVEAIRTRTPTEVLIIGHTDTLGADEVNDKLARERAAAVERSLRTRIPSLTRVSIQSFGSKDPLVVTPPNVNEPRNRRVEVVIL